MSISNHLHSGMPFTLTDEQVRAYWGGHPEGRLHCSLCGKKLHAGDTVRWIYTNSTPYEDGGGGNPMVCQECDGPREKILARVRELRQLGASLRNTIVGREFER